MHSRRQHDPAYGSEELCLMSKRPGDVHTSIVARIRAVANRVCQRDSGCTTVAIGAARIAPSSFGITIMANK